ncbi:hypothetical protein G6F32_016938 [Rhizopus arrhizus]|nr:hypothetical protein G6F32_016938 [Rhizopus arrhizus]
MNAVGRVQHGVDVRARRRVVLRTARCDLDGAHDVAQAAAIFPAPAAGQAIEQTAALGVAATRRVDDLRGAHRSDLDGLAVRVQRRAFSAARHHHRLKRGGDVGHAAAV